MEAYLAIKFHEDLRNRELIEQISEALRKAGFETTVMVRDHEKWGEVKFTPEELMKLTFQLIDKSDVLVIELSEKGVGLGIEAGYARSKNIPIIIIAKKGSEISNTMRGVARQIIFYGEPEELAQKFRELQL